MRHGVRGPLFCLSGAKYDIVSIDEISRQRLSGTRRQPGAAIQPMKLNAFKQSLGRDVPPADIDDLAVQALWFAAKGNWTRAHELAQARDDATGAWVHAYLHRVEGDTSNAHYWYRRASRQPHSGSLAEEWDEIAADLI